MRQDTSLTNHKKVKLGQSGVAGWLLKLLRKSNCLLQEETQLHLLGTLALGGRKQLMLVACGGERFLIGGGTDRIEVIIPVKPEAMPEMPKR